MKSNFTLRIAFTLILCLVALTSLSDANYFTSTMRMQELAEQEGKLLQELKEYGFSLLRFIMNREAIVQAAKEGNAINTADHPNAAFLLLKAYVHKWNNLLSNDSDFRQHLPKTQKVSLPTMEDYSGAADSVLRLQKMYKLTAAEIVKGNYSGYIGPRLSYVDAFFIGKQAYLTAAENQSHEWLNTTLDVRKNENKNTDDVDKLAMRSLMTNDVDPEKYDDEIMEDISGMRKVMETMKHSAKVRKQNASYSAPEKECPADSKADEEASADAYHDAYHDAYDDVYQELCTRPKDQIVDKREWFHVCRYKPSRTGSYVRYKEEIISTDPYVSLVYDVISDVEIDSLINSVKDKMHRARIGQNSESSMRISNVGWVGDALNPDALRLSLRIQDMTWLSALSHTAEPYQLVNYGIGGQYEPHHDPLQGTTFSRVATFLIYLTDVEIGGSTVFLTERISVSPVKGMALFWYNLTPDMADDETDRLTLHAGCPVLKGHKWIANKWIWNLDNMFTRPCGPIPESTQLDIEEITRK